MNDLEKRIGPERLETALETRSGFIGLVKSVVAPCKPLPEFATKPLRELATSLMPKYFKRDVEAELEISRTADDYNSRQGEPLKIHSVGSHGYRIVGAGSAKEKDKDSLITFEGMTELLRDYQMWRSDFLRLLFVEARNSTSATGPTNQLIPTDGRTLAKLCV